MKMDGEPAQPQPTRGWLTQTYYVTLRFLYDYSRNMGAFGLRMGMYTSEGWAAIGCCALAGYCEAHGLPCAAHLSTHTSLLCCGRLP